MARFGYTVVREFRYATQKQVAKAITSQWQQEWRNNGVSDRIGDILVKDQVLSQVQRDEVLKYMVMEPNISWGKGTIFGGHLSIHKAEKQLLGECVGALFAQEDYDDSTVFLSGSTTVYYCFRGLVKSGARVRVRTVNAAILSAYPSVESRIREVSTLWEGRVDLDNAIIAPVSPTAAADALPRSMNGVTDALLSCVCYDSVYGPVISNETARLIARYLLASGKYVCHFVVDHSKIRNGGSKDKDDPKLLFRDVHEWREVRNTGNVSVIVDVHPGMPREKAAEGPSIRQTHEIRNLLEKASASEQEIRDVLDYQEWSIKVRDQIRREVLHPHQR